MTTNKINAAESIRGLACLAVVLSHISLTFFPQLHNFDASRVPQYEFLAQLHHSPLAFFYSGTGAVFVFFVLSGFVLSLSSFKKQNSAAQLKTSLIKRYPRLAIPTFVSCVIAYLVCFIPVDVSHVSEWGAALANPHPQLSTALYEGSIGAFLFGDSSYNWVLWTMQIELLGSLVIYLACYFYGKLPILCGLFLILSVITAYLISQTVLLGILSFILGMGLFLYAVELSTVVSVVLFILGLYLCGAHNSSASYQFFTRFLGEQTYDYLNFVGGFCIVYAVLKGQWLAQCFDRTVWVFLGKISFSIYLIHLAVLYALGIPLFNFFYVQGGLSYLNAGLLASVVIMLLSILLAQPYSRYVDDAAIKISNKLAKMF
ncbi:acyltransferase [Acinetobacter colistiniresistens]|uniref:acyltransferase family protein n=1 Tax=Acinetobacter colistiniresistens TaxID=280145 RepID=UPI00211C41A1|nr:acyltransferase [Acinetobacter colistiniresistens]UUM28249.1 acyltransferase [Acinetobacter colistiniresistens]